MGNVLSPNNRIDYGRSLMPDEGWFTSWAIGTTYSLELETLMGIPLALFHGKYLSETTDISNLRTDMLDALNKVRDRMYVFVHENNISSRCGYSMLIGFLDQNICNITVDNVNMNFHPKVWLVRYEKDNHGKAEHKYRLIVMSRNITGATDFDIAVAMDSYTIEKDSNENDSLISMMKYLMEKTNREDIIRQFHRELKRVKFKSPESFSSKPPIFWPQNINEFKSPLLKDNQYDEILVISPFVDDQTLDKLSKRVKCCKPILVSREYELDKCSPDALQKWDCYQWNTMLEDAADYEETESSESESNSSRGLSLHAKIFIIKSALDNDFKSWNNWFIGSTNCTNAGIKRNIEAQLQLKSNAAGTSPREVLAELKNPDAPLITEYIIKQHPVRDEKEDLNKLLRNIRYELSHMDMIAELNQEENETYSLSVGFDRDKWDKLKENYKDAKVTISPFANNGDKWLLFNEPHHRFTSVCCQQLSAFLRVSVKLKVDPQEVVFLLHMGKLVMPEERHGKIMSEILDSELKLMRYIMFCLDENTDLEQQMIGIDTSHHHRHSDNSSCWDKYSLPIYEKLLLASSRNPRSLRSVKQNIERLRDVKDKEGKPLLSKEFLKMWNLFSSYVK